MSEQPIDATVPDADLGRWIVHQRWYAAKGSTPALTTISTDDHTRLVLDDAPTGPVLYQAPVLPRAGAGVSQADDSGTHDSGSDDSGTTVADAVADLDWIRGLTARIDADPDSLRPIGRVTAARVLGGEQSNTSVICDTESGGRVIVKVFRVLHHGDNPDVTTQLALSAAGSSRVPAVYGSLRATWPDPGRPEGTATGHLAVAQEFLPGLQDAWRVALDEARVGAPFDAEGLGAALAEVHGVLARVLPTAPTDADARRAALDTMLARLAAAEREAPAIAPHVEAVRAVYARAEQAAWPDLQRIHGDLHLGQVLAAGGPRGWVFLDFEGEPLRPLHERSVPDVPLRDVAGMLRSFDYVAGAIARDADPVDASGWARTARAGFLAGYERATGTDLHAHREVLDAFELDKAVYEVVYESRNRPDWVGIPLAAVTALVAHAAS